MAEHIEPASGLLIAIIVVNYKSSHIVRDNLAARRLPDWIRVVMVDNFSSASEARACAVLCERLSWTFVANSQNAGFGAACNRGARVASSWQPTHFLFLNPDASISPAEIEHLAISERKAFAGIVSPVILREDSSPWFNGAKIDWNVGRAHHMSAGDKGESDWATAACLLFSLEAWQILGGFREDYFLYWEDVEITHRWRDMGRSLVIVPEVSATHMVGATQETEALSKSPQYIYYNIVNRAKFARDHGRRTLQLRWLLLTPIYAAHICRITWRSFIGAGSGVYWIALGKGLIASTWVLFSTSAGRPAI